MMKLFYRFFHLFLASHSCTFWLTNYYFCHSPRQISSLCYFSGLLRILSCSFAVVLFFKSLLSFYLHFIRICCYLLGADFTYSRPHLIFFALMVLLIILLEFHCRILRKSKVIKIILFGEFLNITRNRKYCDKPALPPIIQLQQIINTQTIFIHQYSYLSYPALLSCWTGMYVCVCTHIVP